MSADFSGNHVRDSKPKRKNLGLPIRNFSYKQTDFLRQREQFLIELSAPGLHFRPAKFSDGILCLGVDERCPSLFIEGEQLAFLDEPLAQVVAHDADHTVV